MTGNSTLDPDNIPAVQPDRVLGKGHGTGALGPSDSSDSGSDTTGGQDVGDAYLESDTDSSCTGETAAVGRDNVAPDGSDIGFDHVETVPFTTKQERDDVERGS
jgi:hypothetical protein